MNIIIPLAGDGRRFVEAGFPEKPFVDLDGKTLIQTVLESLPEPWLDKCNFVFVTRKEYTHRIKGIAANMQITCKVVETGPTKGAACSVLLARNVLSSVKQKSPLVILNGDQIVRFSLLNFNTLANIVTIQTQNLIEVGGVIPVFRATGPKWSYVKLDNYNRVVGVAEKDPVSEWGTCGIYFWTSTETFFECAENMIYNERRVNNEYYVAPVYNEVVKYKIKTGIVLALEVNQMVGLGTPEDVKEYLGRGKCEW